MVYLEYEKIGLDLSKFPRNNITNNMLLFDNCIPVMKNGKWGLFDKNGNQILDTVYDSIGYIAGTKKDTAENNLAVIPDIEGIVVCKDEKYGIVNSRGKFIAPCSFDKIYSITNLGKDTYYLTYGTQTITLEDYQKLNGNQSSDVPTESTTTDNTTTDTTNTTNTVSTENNDTTNVVQ